MKELNRKMKLKTALAGALVAAGMISHASADQVVYLTGSTAFRSTIYNALHTPGVVFSGAPTEVTFGGSSAAGANYMIFHGTVSNTPVYIDCAWSGSEAGIASASGVTLQNTDRNGNPIALAGSPETWVAVTNVTLDGTHYSSNPTSAQLESSSHASDLAQADTSQAVSLTPYVAGTSTALYNFGSEGVVTFTWCKNMNTTPSQAWTNFTNVTLEQAFIELSSPQPAGFFTGNTNDDSEYVYLVGRNKGSGTRANTLSDTGYGTTTEVNQYSIGYGIEEPASGTLVITNEGNNGYESGGGVGGALKIDGSCQQTDPFTGNSGWIAIGYISPADALANNLQPGVNWLSYDGVMESDGAIEEGQYSFWGHEHLYGSANISGVQLTVGQALFNGVKTELSTLGSDPTAHDAAISYNYMNCTKASDVAYPVHN